MNILKITPYIFCIYFILFNNILYSIYGNVYNIKKNYKKSISKNSPLSIYIASSNGKQIYIHSMIKNDLNDVKKEEQLSQIVYKSANEKTENNIKKSNINNIMEKNKNKEKDYTIISEYYHLPSNNNFDFSTTIEPLTKIYQKSSSNKAHKYDTINNLKNKDISTEEFIFLKKDSSETLDVSNDSSMSNMYNELNSVKDNYFSITTGKTTTVFNPFLKNNLQLEKSYSFKKFENNNLHKEKINSSLNNKVSQPYKWNFKKISAKIENTSNNNFYNNDNITLTKSVFLLKKQNYKSHVIDDVNVDKKVNNNLSQKINSNKKNNMFFKYLNVKLENMINDEKYYKENFSKEIDIINGQKEVESNNIKNIKNDNKNISKTDEIEIVFDEEEEDDVLAKFFNNKKENKSLYSLENKSIGEHVTIEEVQYDENDINDIIQFEDEYDTDFLEEGEHFDYNETMLTEFINDTLKRDEETLRITLVDKMLLEKDIFDKIGDYSGSHIYPTLISQNYNNNSLPIMFSDIPVYVMVSLDILDISSFNMQSMDYVIDVLINMRWYDMRLIHKMNKPISINEEKILHKIWRPDPYIVNAKKSYLHKITFPNIKMRIFPDGLVLYTIHITIQPSCNMKFCMFPHDQQECYLDLSSLSYSDEQLKFIWKEEPYFLVNLPTLPEFKITNITVNECLSHDKLITSSCLRLAFKLRRDSAKYIVEKYIPSTLAMMFAWVAPYVPYNYEDVRIVTPITILLALVQMQKGEIETRTSYLTSLDKWFAVMKVFSVISLMESLVVLSLVRKFRELKKKENKAINEFEKEMIKLQQIHVKKLYNRIDLYARIISPVVFILYLIYYLLFMVNGNEKNC